MEIKRKKISILNEILIFLLPTLSIRSKLLLDKWTIKYNDIYKKQASAFLIFFSLVYIFHYHFIDVPSHKEPISLYFKYRYGLGLLAFLCGILTILNSKTNIFLLRIPLIISGLNFGYWQSQSMLWRPDIPYMYSVLFPLFTALFLKVSPLNTFLYLMLSYFIQYESSWVHFPDQLRFIFSACFAGSMILVAIRSRMQTEIRYFLLEELNMQNQKKIIEYQTEINNQIRTFLPTELFKRFEENTRIKKMSVIESIDEILRPKEKFIAVFLSDIRGYTKLVKDNLKTYATKDYLPQQKFYTNKIDKNKGIPRVVGDQIFAYFDDDNKVESVLSAIKSAHEIILNISNESSHSNRPIIISCGIGITGNVGGTDSARIISVVGNAANLPSRIDSITKEKELSNLIFKNTIILTTSTAIILKAAFNKLNFSEFSLINTPIRDFSEEKSIFLFNITKETEKIILGPYNHSAASLAVMNVINNENINYADENINFMGAA